MKDKIICITGATSGIGLALAHHFGNRGSKLVLAARNKAALQQIVAQFQTQKTEALGVVTDVTREEDCKNLIEQAVLRFGGVDILICNAGISMRALFDSTDLKVLEKVMQVNFWGAVYCCKYALPHLQKSKGSIVGISSIAGKVGLPGRSGYSASKFALEGFLQTLRIENLKKGLHILVACPGFTASNIRQTALTATGETQGETPRDESKMMSAETCALHIYNAVLSRRRDLVLTRQGHLTQWFNRFFPAFLDRTVYKTMAKEKDSPLK